MLKRFSIALLALLLVLCGGAALALTDVEASSPSVNVPAVPEKEQPLPQETKTVSDELARITQSVKTTLAIDDSYTDFYGEQTERGYGVSWALNWSSAESSLSVEVDKDGLITAYYRYEYSDRYYSSDFAPIFPQAQSGQARKIAEDFARLVLAKGETVVFQDNEKQPEPLNQQNSYYFSGYIAYNGVPTPLYVSISVNAANMRVDNFWRDSLNPSYIGGIPSGTAKIAPEAAKAKLAPQSKFTLAYYRSETSPTEARLQYRPVQDNTFYVDAVSGALLDMNKLYAEAQDKTIDRGIAIGGRGDGEMAYSMATADNAAAPQAVRLSPTEQAGVEKMEGLLTREQLDAKIRAMSEFGVGKNYILRNFNYRQENRDGETRYVASLQYYAESNASSLGISDKEFKRLQDEGQRLYTEKFVTMDAGSGELQNLYTYRPYVNELLITAKRQPYQKETEAFLQRYCSEKFAETTMWRHDVGSGSGNDYFRYAQKVNGYYFEENSISIAANPFTGEIEEFSAYGWVDDITFAPATGIISEEQARRIYVDSLECRLVYRGLPQAIDPGNPQVKPLMEYGYSMLYSLALVYSVEEEYPHNVYAIDALEGTTLTYAQQAKGALSYDDIAGQAAQAQIEKLAGYGIGFTGGKFLPAAKLTELDMLVFLLSAQGWSYSPQELTKEKTDEIYRQAYGMGILERGQKQPERQISRGDFVKTLISMSGYGKTARLPGIYVCNFADAAQIPAELYGYVAIAQGLGIVQGGADKQFKHTEIIGRAEAAVLFHNFLNRKY